MNIIISYRMFGRKQWFVDTVSQQLLGKSQLKMTSFLNRQNQFFFYKNNHLVTTKLNLIQNPCITPRRVPPTKYVFLHSSSAYIILLEYSLNLELNIFSKYCHNGTLLPYTSLSSFDSIFLSFSSLSQNIFNFVSLPFFQLMFYHNSRYPNLIFSFI